jgi:two-component system chemotaxis response regulator CheY
MVTKIIVVDDSPVVRQQLGIVLGQAGFEIIEAVDGQQGVDVVNRTPDAAMIICDVHMPVMDGLSMLEIIKKDGAHPNLVVLMLTTEGDPPIIDRAKKSGAKGWITKPFKADLLVAAVKKLLVS